MKLIRYREGKKSQSQRAVYKGIDLQATFNAKQGLKDISNEIEEEMDQHSKDDGGTFAKMKHFSRGQQTVIAISLILAL